MAFPTAFGDDHPGARIALMANYYFDASAAVKRYVLEAGTAWVDDIVAADDEDEHGRPAHLIAFVNVGIVEVIAAFARRQRMGELSPKHRDALTSAFLHDVHRRYVPLAVSEEILRHAIELVARRDLRAYDAIHLASANALNQQLTSAGLSAITFVSADQSLCRAATSEGLDVHNPNES